MVGELPYRTTISVTGNCRSYRQERKCENFILSHNIYHVIHAEETSQPRVLIPRPSQACSDDTWQAPKTRSARGRSHHRGTDSEVHRCTEYEEGPAPHSQAGTHSW